MLQRKIYDELENWKQSRNKKCLIIRGARQVGKTYAVRQFAKNYEEFLEINFKELPSAMSVFAGDLNVDNMLLALRFRFPEKKILPGKTLLFFDEIQECEEAITSLKFWSQDKRFDVIASGSMLGIDYKRASSYPVGYVDFIDLYGLDFEEFLWSQNITGDMVDAVSSCFENVRVVPEDVHNQMMQLFRIYTALGGMPEVIQTYIDSCDFREVDKVQKNLLQGYLYDIAHYASAFEKIKAEQCFLSVNRQLLEKENHKFQYKEVEKRGNAQKFYSSIEWLVRADIVVESKNVTTVRYDLTDYEIAENFRIYTSDLSLLIAMRDFHLKQEIVENTLTGNTKGGLYECAAAVAMIKKGYMLHFYKNETTKKEIDMLIQKDGEVIPIEIKAGNRTSLSLNQLMKNTSEIHRAYKFIDGNMGTGEHGIVTAPLYMLMFV